MRRHLFILLAFLTIIFLWLGWYFFSSAKKETTTFTVQPGASAYSLGKELRESGIVRSVWLFRAIASLKGIDTMIQSGTYEVEPPVTLLRVLDALAHPENNQERTITIIPGWDLRDIAEYLETQQVVSSTEFFRVAGEPLSADNKDGYLAPETYRIFANASAEEIVKKLTDERMKQLAPLNEAMEQFDLKPKEVITLASIVEREVTGKTDRAMIADIFLRRLKNSWALQADSTVHYMVGKRGTVFTTREDRESESLWNTYKYPGLPPGPICNPSVESIEAVLNHAENNFWYFLTTPDGEVKYARTLEEHNENVARWLR